MSEQVGSVLESIGGTRGEPVRIGKGAVTGVLTTVIPTSYGFMIEQEAYGQTTFVSITREEASALAGVLSQN